MRKRLLPRRCHSCGCPHIVRLLDAGLYPLNEAAAGRRLPDAAFVPFEQEDAEIFLERLHAR